MIDPKAEPTKHAGLRLSESMVATIRKSGQNTSDWLRQAIRCRIESDRLTEAAPSHLEKQVAALQQRIDDLKKDGADTRKEIARFQQSESITQATLAEMRKTLAAIQQNQGSLDQTNAGFGHAFNALGQSLLVALGQQLDRYAQKLAAREDETPPFVLPPIPPDPGFESWLSLFRISKPL